MTRIATMITGLVLALALTGAAGDRGASGPGTGDFKAPGARGATPRPLYAL